MFVLTCVLFLTFSEIKIFECTNAELLIRKRYYVYVLFLIPVFIVQVTELVQFIINVKKYHRPIQSILQLVWRHGVLYVWVRLDVHLCRRYIDFLQNELLKQLEDVPLATRIAVYLQHTESLLIIPYMWCNISMTLPLIGGSVAAVPLTGHKDLQTYPC
jgi:hypothetical protein